MAVRLATAKWSPRSRKGMATHRALALVMLSCRNFGSFKTRAGTSSPGFAFKTPMVVATTWCHPDTLSGCDVLSFLIF
eukprot:1198837-Lingulodinium_polyedra.AAC.1